MIEGQLIETMNGYESHALLVERAENEGFDVVSHHVTFDLLYNCRVYTTFLKRGSRPGTLNKASVIEALERENKVMQQQITALGEAIKALSMRLDATIRDFHADDDEVVPNNWLEDYMDNLRALNPKPQIIPVSSIRIHGTDYREDVISEALREDEELGL